MEKSKEMAKHDFVEMIMKSWTYLRLDEKEKAHALEALQECNTFGTYRQRWEILHGVYCGFLYALGYSDNPATWREAEQVPQF